MGTKQLTLKPLGMRCQQDQSKEPGKNTDKAGWQTRQARPWLSMHRRFYSLIVLRQD